MGSGTGRGFGSAPHQKHKCCHCDTLLKEMHEKYAGWHFEPDLEAMLSLLAFHKEEKHKSEQEIRLMHVPHLFDDRAYVKFDFHVSNIRAGLSKYVETPLFVDDKERAWHYRVKRHEVKNDSSLPLFKITSIEFGDNEPRFDQKKLDAMRNDLSDYLVAKFGYKIEVKEKLFETGIGK